MPSSFWAYQESQIKASNSSVQTCPMVTPYYNGNSCIACHAPTEYFNLKSRECESCNGTHQYNSSQRDCINMESGAVAVSGSIVKMSGSLFSHQ